MVPPCRRPYILPICLHTKCRGDKMDQEHVCLTDLLDQDLTAYEYFQTLPPQARRKLLEREITSFEQLQSEAAQLLRSQEMSAE